MDPVTRSLPIEVPLDLKATLRPLHGVFAGDGWWLAARTPHGSGSLRIRRTREELIGEAWGEGSLWLLDRLDSIAGLADEPRSFQTDHPIVGELHRRHPGWRFGKTDLVFDALVHGIVEQKVTGHEAHAAMRGLRSRFGDAAPGPHPRLRLTPDPVRMAEAPYWVYHELHLERRRADVLKRVAASAGKIEGLRAVPPAKAQEMLLGFRGIGVWTVSKTLAISHGDPDQLDVGDFHLKHMVVHHLTGRDRGTDEEMLELLEPFRPHRGRVARLIHTMGHAPKFGPRVALRDITRM
ncbi:MAG: DNA-3-methyladenine glycosylase 2 family protein [Actinomycetota bacterium]|nr:DNA-3-methyladenine glycosylase 2 family protein [Actinomycetota bacterium]